MSESEKPSIFIIEDEEDIRDLLEYNLTKNGFRVRHAVTGESGMKQLREQPSDLLLLDIMLPQLSGHDVCRILKSDKATQNIPIIMVTARGEEDDIVKGLEMGADDYISKPFQMKELIARVKTVLRRRQNTLVKSTQTEEIKLDPFVWFPAKAELWVGSNKLDLTVSEYKLLELMLSKPGWVFTRGQIMDHVKGESSHSTHRAIDVLVVGLRKKLKWQGADIETIRGIGYRVQAGEK